MFFPEQLYLLGKRAPVRALQPLFDSDSTSATGASPITVECPNNFGDRILLLSNASAVFTPGAAQTANTCLILITSPSSDTVQREYQLAGNSTPTAAATGKWIDWAGFMIVWPRWSIKARGFWSATANANQVTLTIHGVLVPPGSFVEPTLGP